MNIQKVKIANALESTAADGVVAESSAIFDQGLEMYQDALNDALTAGIIRLEEKDVTSVSAITENVTAACSITGASNSGKTEIILYKNDANADVEVTVPSTYVTPDGNDVTITCPSGGFCRVTFSNVGGTVYADVQTATSSTNAVMKNAIIDYEKTHLTFVALESGTFTLTIPSQIDTTYLTSVSYSLNNGSTWVTTENTSETVTITTETIPAGNKVMWKGVGTRYANTSHQAIFSSTGNFDIQGNVMSLLYGDEFEGQKTLTGNYTFMSLFASCSKLKNAHNLVLPATTLTTSCYNSMFANCTSLVSVPELPSTTLATACYVAMFTACTSLTHGPKLPATTMANSCYQGLFAGCSSLQEAPELPAETLVSGCYSYMFNGCTALNRIKCLATTLNGGTSTWVSGVAATGTFVKNPSMSDWEVGTSGIPSGWTVINGFPDSYNIQPDWDISDMTSEAYVRNKPTIPAAQIQSDWGQTDPTAVDYVKNKPNLPKEFVVLSYGHSTWAEAYSAYTENRIVYCRASSNSNPGTGDQTRMAFLAYVNNPTDPTELEFQYYRSVATKNATNYTDQVFAYKFNKTNGWSVQTRSVTPKIVAGTNIVSGYTQGTNPTITISAPNVATLVDGKVPASQLPSYVDDVIELLNMTDTAPSTCATGDVYYNTNSKKLFTATGTNTWSSTGETPESGKIYVNLTDNTTYRWGGSDMAQISASLVIGTTQGTAADGKVVNDHVTDTDIHVTTSDKSTWSGKQDAINDLSDIRSGAASGATAYQMPVSGIPDADLASPIATNSDVDALFAANGHSYVDMGLPSGLLWATCNIGATSRGEYGSYFSWGNVEGHKPTGTTFDYDFGTSNSGPYSGTTGAGLTGNIPTNATYDAAVANMGGNWRMPTANEFAELFNSAYTMYIDANGDEVTGSNKLVTVDGVTGIYLKSKVNNNTLFFPRAGSGYGTSLDGSDSYGFYWSSSFNSSGRGYHLFFYSKGVYPQYDDGRYNGFCVRGVLSASIDPTKLIKLGQLDTYNQKIQEQIGDIESVLSTI